MQDPLKFLTYNCFLANAMFILFQFGVYLNNQNKDTIISKGKKKKKN